MATAAQLATNINYTLGISINNTKNKESAKPRLTEKEREAKARAKAAKANMKAKNITERVNKVKRYNDIKSQPNEKVNFSRKVSKFFYTVK